MLDQGALGIRGDSGRTPGFSEGDWSFAFHTIELASRAFDDDAKISLLTQLRYREKTMSTTWAAREDMRIRYVERAMCSAPRWWSWSTTVTCCTRVGQLHN